MSREEPGQGPPVDGPAPQERHCWRGLLDGQQYFSPQLPARASPPHKEHSYIICFGLRKLFLLFVKAS